MYEHRRDGSGASASQALDGGGGKLATVNHRSERDERGGIGLGFSLGRQQLRCGGLAQSLLTAEACDELLCKLLGAVSRVSRVGAATRQDALMKQPSGARHAHERGAVPSACRLSRKGYPIGIAAKCSDVVSNPFEHQNQVTQRVEAASFVLRSCDGTQLEKTQRPEAVVSADANHTIASKQRPIVGGQTGAPCYITSAINPHQNRMGARFFGCPNVEL